MQIQIFSFLTVCIFFSKKMDTVRIKTTVSNISRLEMKHTVQTRQHLINERSSSQYLISHHESSSRVVTAARSVCLHRHVRNKRIIDISPGPKQSSSLRDVPYIVRIKENENDICGGSILSPKFVITSAHCVIHALMYHVISGTSRTSRGVKHNVTEKIIYNEYVPHGYSNDLALLLITPYINFLASQNRPISLFTGYLAPNSHGTISGWGCNSIGREVAPCHLYSISVPLLNINICADCYKDLATISDREICTFDPKKEKGCSYGDSGAPLVVNDKLVGVLAFTEESTHPQFPAVFVNLRFKAYREWILRLVPHAI